MRSAARILAFLVLSGTVHMARADYSIELSHASASTTPVGQAAAYFAEQVNTRLNGRVHVQVSPETDLPGGAGWLETIRAGGGEVGYMTVAPLSSFVALAPGLRVYELPLLFDEVGDVHKLVDSAVGAKLLAPLEASGVKGLTVWDEGMTVLSVKGARPLRESPADFTGKRFGVQGSGVPASTIQALGGVAEELPAGDVYAALAQHTLDGYSGAWADIVTNGYQEVQDWISVSNHSYRGYLVVVGAEFWNGLPEEIRGQFSAILAEATGKARELAAESAAEYRKRVEEDGRATVLGLVSDERGTWRAATSGVATRVADEIGPELFSEVQALLKH